MQDTVSECRDFAARQFGVVGEADGFGPGDQIDCCHDDFEPGGVGVEGVERQVAQAGGFGLADPVFDAGVLAMPQFQPGELTRHHTVGGVGEKTGDAVSIGVGEPHLRTRMRAFLAEGSTGYPPAKPAPESIAGCRPSALLSTSTASRIGASIAAPRENPTPDVRQAAANP